MANTGYGNCTGRFDQEGPTGTQRQRPKVRSGETFQEDPMQTLRAETRANQFRHGGWDKLNIPSDSSGQMDTDDLPQAYARGGNADTHLSADYPGGTVA